METKAEHGLYHTIHKKLKGERKFSNGTELKDFWSWAYSDMLSNAQRGILAEYIVAMALGCTDTIRTEWGTYDLETTDGIKVEVKSSAYIQSWKQKRPSEIKFSIPKTKACIDEYQNKYEAEAKRHADVYVFCLFNPNEADYLDNQKGIVNNMLLSLWNWGFYVVPTQRIDAMLPHAKTLSMSRLEKLVGKEQPISFNELEQAVHEACLRNQSSSSSK